MVFAGGGGAVNLAVSNWIRDKGWAMGTHAPRVVSPLTNSEEAGSGTGFEFELTDENKARWQRWWRNAKIEQFWCFAFVGSLSIIIFVLIAYSVLGVGNYQGKGDLSFVKLESELLADKFGDFTKIAFLVIGSVALLFANLVVVDLVARITADVLAVNYLREHRFWTEAKVYATVVWVVVTLGVLILAAGLTAPIALLAISAVLNGLVMVVYCALLIRVNRSLHPFLAMGAGAHRDPAGLDALLRRLHALHHQGSDRGPALIDRLNPVALPPTRRQGIAAQCAPPPRAVDTTKQRSRR